MSNFIEETFTEMIAQKDKAISDRDGIIESLTKRIDRLVWKVDEDADTIRRLLLQIREMGGDVIVHDREGKIINEDVPIQR